VRRYGGGGNRGGEGGGGGGGGGRPCGNSPATTKPTDMLVVDIDGADERSKRARPYIYVHE